MGAAIDRLLDVLPGARRTGDGWSARCPAHEDRNASLSVSEGDDGRALVHCHAGCAVEDILSELSLTVNDLFPPTSTSTEKRIVATYDYTDEDGTMLYQVVRYEPKDFRQRRPNGAGWTWKLGSVRRVPYRLPRLLEAVERGRWVVIVEGEKDVHTLDAFGIVATCNAGGAGKWPAEFAAYLKGAKVAVIPDNDTVGEKHAQSVARSLKGIAAKVVPVARVSKRPGGDVTDWLSEQDDRAAAIAELKQLIESGNTWEPTAEDPARPTPEKSRATAQPPALAYEERILDRLRTEVRRRGLVGEERNAEILYLVATSRLLDQQASAAIKGGSASGKSHTVNTVLDYFPTMP
jgi:5S rRNA maturation endonuclease (ribonuclease M5)